MKFSKEKYKKFIALVTVCVLLVGILPTGVYGAGETGTGINWGANITETITGTFPDKVLTLSGSGPMNNFAFNDGHRGKLSGISTIVINDGITTIGNYAFDTINITSVTIPGSVTSIGTNAFAYNELTSLTIPSSVKSIGEYAFRSNQLTALEIPSSVTSIGNAAFMYNKLTSLTIPNSLETIGAYAFMSNQLTALEIPNSVTSIGYAAFSGNQLTSLTIPDSVKKIDDGVFSENKLTSIIIPDSVTSIGAGAFSYNKLTTITLPDSLISIGSSAFAINELTSVTIPNSVKNIDEQAFVSNNLTQITIPANVTIGDRLLVLDYTDSVKANYFRAAYISASSGAGTYTGTQTGTWSKAVPIDTSRYDELVNSVNSIIPSAYTTQSFAEYNAAIASVNLTLTNANTQEEINAEVNKIQNALDLLVLRPLELAPNPDFSIEPLEPPQVGKILLIVSTLPDSTIYYKQVDEFKSRGLGESFNPDGWTVYTAPTIVSADNGMLFEVVIVDAMGKVLQSGGFELNDGTVTAFDFSIEIPQKILVGNTINFGVNVTPSTGKYNGFDFKSSNPDVATLLWTGMPGLQIKAVAPGTVNFILTATDAGKFERVISVEVVDRSGLVDAINYFAGIKTQESKYTPETFGVLYDLDWYIRQAYYQYPDLTFAEYEDLLLRFNAAKNGLVLINVVDTQAVAAAKAAIVDGTVNVAYGADQTAKTAAVQTYVNTLLTGEAAGVTAIVTYVSANNYSVAISKGEANDTKTITMTINEGADPDTTAVNDAKTAAEDESYADMNQGVATDEGVIKNAIKAEAEAAVNDNRVTVTINTISYTAPIAGTAGTPGGTNGSYVFTITVSKGEQIQTTEQKTITITAAAYTGVTAAQAVAAAKAAIIDGTVNVAYGADQTAKTAAVQTYVNTLLTGDAAGVTAIVTYGSENNYSVAISKDGTNDTKTIAMTINIGADPDITTVNNAKTAVEDESYADMNQGVATDEGVIKNAIKAEAEAAVNDNRVTVTINTISYTAPIAGTAGTPGGTNGSYVFTITVSKGEQIQTTEQKTITITAAAYSPVPTYSVSGNVKDSHSVDVSNAEVKLMLGQKQIGSTVQTNESGEFIITDVPNGNYNLVVKKHDIIVTTLITVNDGNYASGAITLPNGKTNSIVEVRSDNLPLVVGGLDAQFTAAASIEDNKGITEDNKNVVASGGTVEIKFTAEKKAENAAPNASNIAISATADGKTVGMFIDLSVVKTVTTSDESPSTTTTALVELPYLIEVFIPLEEALQGKSGYVIYRYHGVGVDTITTTPNEDREQIELVDNGKTLKLKVKKFSTYAISYASPVVPPIDNKGSAKAENISGNDSVTIKNTDGGTIKESPKSTNTEKIFDITPNAGYVIADILVGGKSVGAAKEYILKDLTKKVEIQAIFVKATAIPYYVDITGKEIFIKYSGVIDGVMKYIAPQGVTVLFKDNTKYFNDINGHWAGKEINFAAERELFVGTAPKVFSPDLSMTRFMFVTVLGRLYEASFGEIKESANHPFADTEYDSWYTKYVNWAYENGIISGVGGGKFEPDRAITRQEMAVVVDNYLKFTKFATPANQQYITFDDEENIGEWAKASVQSMQKLGIIGVMENYTFNPKGIATRAQAATILYRMIDIVLN